MAQTIKYYTDKHISKAVIKGLREHGIDVLTVPDTGMYSVDDELHLERARSENRVVFTQDTDFLKLHADGVEHAGIDSLLGEHLSAMQSVA